ncbi:MAG: MEDS domain-containing protein [Methanobacteriaceae archaeon]|nr:MEDS domain-containing protein [Methanobacteriaceae archaeon]
MFNIVGDDTNPGFQHTFEDSYNLKDALKSLKPHDHLCLIYESLHEWQDAIIPFIRIGLERGEKCVYIVDSRTARELRTILKEEAIDVEYYEDAGQLVVLNHSDAYTLGGIFDPDSMIQLLINETRKALDEGFTALRATGEMTWVLKGNPGSERLLEYEAKLNRDFFPEYPCVAICQYDRWQFDPEIIKGVVMTHPLLIKGNKIYKNFYYIPPEDFLNAKKAEREVQQWFNNLEREREIKDKKNLYADLLNKSSQPFAIGFPDGKLAFNNQAFNDLIGYSEEEIKKLDWATDLTPSKWTEKEQEMLQKLEKTGQPVRYEKEYIKKDGTILPIELLVHPVYDHQGKLRYYYAFITDISKRKEMEKKIWESEKKYRALFDNAGEGIFILKDEEFIECNKKALELFKVTRDQIIGETPYSIYSPEIQPDGESSKIKARKYLADALSGNTVKFEWQHLKSDGTPFYAGITLNRIDLNGEYFVQAIIEDLTQKKEAERSLIEAKEKYRIVADNTYDWNTGQIPKENFYTSLQHVKKSQGTL